MTITRKRSASYADGELSCLYCGHDTMAPARDAHGVPRCPRCAARLFIELRDRRPRSRVAGRMSGHRTRAKTDEEREDAYAREDVYVGAPEIDD
jgi:DNA-directed RNA polymerase subunit RPC12/RpoP